MKYFLSPSKLNLDVYRLYKWFSLKLNTRNRYYLFYYFNKVLYQIFAILSRKFSILELAHLQNVADVDRYFSSFVDYVDSRNILRQKLLANNVNRSERDRLLFDQYLIECNYVDAMKCFLTHYMKIKKDNDLGLFIKGKKVLYVGPGHIKEWPDPTSFDFVVVSNMLIDYSQLPKSYNYSKLIIFYNYGFYCRNFKQIKEDSRRISLGLCKSSKDTEDLFDEYTDFSSGNWSDYGLMGAPNIIANICVSDVQELTIVGVDNFLAQSPFRAGIKSYTPNKQHFANIIRRHDAVVNYLFIKFLIISFDCNVKNSIYDWQYWSLVEYCSQLDEMYGHLPLKPLKGYGY